MGFNRKLIFILLLISFLSIAAVDAHDLDCNDQLADSNANVECSSVVDVVENENGAQNLSVGNGFDSYNENSEILKESVDFNGNTLNDLQNEVNNRVSGDVIILKNDLISDGFYPVSINKSITIDGNGHTIDVQERSRIFDIAANNVALKNINFINAKRGVAIYADHINNLKISYCNFTNNNVEIKNGSAIYLSFCDECTIDHCSFTNSSGGLGNVNLYASFACNISYCNFENNFAYYGGAIFLSNDWLCSIYRCSFKNNTAYYSGGAGLLLSSLLISVVDSAFENNIAGFEDGGAIDIMGSTAIFNNCTFEDNIANYRGGAICWTEDYGDINNCSFVNNSAKLGSALYLGSVNNTISNSVFLNNTVFSYLSIDNSTFGEVIVTLLSNENYVNAIFSQYDVAFKNVTYWNGSSIVTSDNPIKSNYLKGQDIIFEIIDSNNVSSTVGNITNGDGQAILNYLDFPNGNYTLNAYHPENSYNSNASGNCTFTAKTYGIFDLLQVLVMSTESNHVLNLSSNYTYAIGRDTITEGIVINKPITIDGNGYTIDAQGKSRIFNISANNVKIINLNLINSSYEGSGGAIYWKGDNGAVDNCSFVSNSADNGSAIYFEGKNNTISNSLFLNNSLIFYFDVDDTIFGSVIITLSTNENYINSIYSKNSVKFNNVTYSKGKSVVTTNDPIQSQYIIGQNVILEIYDNNNNLINITDKTNLDGQVVLNYLNFTVGSYYLEAYVLENNYTPYLSGNCTFTARPYTDFELLQSVIVSAESYDVITLSRNYTYDVDMDSITKGIVITKPITIDGNGYTIDARGKSRIFMITGDNVKIMNLNFVNSSFFNEGGAIYCQADNMLLSLCTFENNSANKGGAVYIKGSNNTVNFCAFSNNHATSTGGAVYFTGHEGTIDTCAFDNNSANFAGALYLDFTGLVYYCGFKNNSATNYGGAMELATNKGSASYAIIYNCDFNSNVAGIGGGAISFSENNRVSVYRTSFTHNVADIGGAILNMNSTNSIFDNCTFIDNNVGRNGGSFYCYGVHQSTLNNCSFLNNSADLGASIYWTGNLNLLNDLIFENNVADDSGVVFLQGDNNLINASVFKNNHADFGGAIYCQGNHNLFDVCIFEYNVADSDGGAIQWRGDYNLLRNSIFEFNVAGNFGGAVYWACRDSLLFNCSFLNNSAFNGGAIYTGDLLEDVGNNIVNSSVFKFNNAHNGGAIYWNSYDSRLDDSILMYNAATDKGGAIYYSKIAILSNSVFLNNKANVSSLDLNVISNNISVSFSGNENYINALYSEVRLGFLNVTYWNGDIVNTDVVRPNYTVLESGVNITITFYDSLGNVIESVTQCTDENGHTNYIYSNEMPYAHFEVSHFDDDYYYQVTEVVNNTKGAFEYLKDLIEYSPENSTINLNYSYVYNDDLDNITEGIEINKNITINGNGHVIDALHKTGIFKINADNVVLRNITFINAGISNSSSLGAIRIDSVNVKILDCNFSNNTAYNGGAIMVISSNTTIDGCTFANNSATDSGGAICCSGHNLIVNNTNMINNVAEMGGAVILESSQNSVLSNINFTGNRALRTDGGAVVIFSPGNKVLGCTFVNNSAKLNGGGIYVYGNNIVVNSSIFEYNSGKDGGAIYAYGNNIVVNSSTFEYNSANRGGAIYWECENSHLNDSIFEYNSANRGGAIYWNGENSQLDNSIFEYNVAVMGGAIYYVRSAGISNTVFLNNKANLTSFDVNVNFNTINLSLSGNENYINAIYSEKSLTFSNVTYWNGDIVNTDDVRPNRTNLESGVNITITFYDSLGNILERITRFTEKGTLSHVFNDLPYSRLEIAHFEDDYYTQDKQEFNNTKGAFEYLKELIGSCPENGIVDLYYNHVYDEDLDNITEGIEINKNITINGNGHVIDALHKTGIFKINGGNVVVKNIIFKNAGSSGFGAIEASSSKITVLNCSFINNTAQNGGAISLNGSDATVGGSSFVNNTAVYGAAIYLFGGENVIRNCSFINNSAQNGGAISLNGSDGTVDGSSFVNNTAVYGAAIYLFGGENVIRDCSFMNNVANSNGVIYGQANTLISDCTFESDNSDIYADGNTDLINNVIGVSVYNYGALNLSNNKIDKFIYNSGNILSQTYIRVLLNSTVMLMINNSVNLFAQVYDDNINPIITASKLSFVLSNGTIIDAIFDEYAVLNADYLFTQNGTYGVSVKYDSLNNCKIFTGSVEVFSIAPKPDLIIEINGAVDGEPTVISISLPSSATGNITIIVDGVEYEFGTTANLVLNDLEVGNHTLVVIYSGDSIYDRVVKNMSFVVNDKNQTPIGDKIHTNIIASNFKGYTIDYKAGERGKYFTITLKDKNGKPLSNKKLKVTLASKKYSLTTNAKGIAKLQISLQKAGNYKITISFSGDNQYKASSAVKTVKIIKKKTKIKAKKRKFKASKKIKKLKVTLQTIKGSSVNGKKYLKAGKKLILKIKGKKYKAKTNKKGKAIFKIKKFKRKGTFKAKIKFKGDKIYKPSSKKIKIKIK